MAVEKVRSVSCVVLMLCFVLRFYALLFNSMCYAFLLDFIARLVALFLADAGLCLTAPFYLYKAPSLTYFFYFFVLLEITSGDP